MERYRFRPQSVITTLTVKLRGPQIKEMTTLWKLETLKIETGRFRIVLSFLKRVTLVSPNRASLFTQTGICMDPREVWGGSGRSKEAN